MSAFSDALLALIKEKGIDQHELARRSGKEYSYINKLCNGRTPKPFVADQLATALRTTPEQRERLLRPAYKKHFGEKVDYDLLSEIDYLKKREPNNTPAKKSAFLWALIKELPDPGSPWTEPAQEAWLKAAKGVFGVVYK